MTAKNRSTLLGSRPLLVRQDVEEIHHVHRIVAGRGHHLSAGDVGLLLGRAAELQEQRI